MYFFAVDSVILLPSILFSNYSITIDGVLIHPD